MKLFILTAALSLGLNAMAAVPTNPTVNEKVIKTFNQVFSEAQNVQWSTTATYSQASFQSGAVATRVMIDNNGALIRTIRYYKENELPSHVLYQIRKKYEGKEIAGVTEISNNEGTSYHIIVNDNRNMYKVTVDNSGSLTQDAKYKRADR
ncbi:hypothetical protein LQ567_17585 [Niabella pedocola]|uniref:Beta-lactamase-inhibitor-like PepSY-like domain-containing protein n=1 Tax=Niabella pedocola TaxID=1752077 RepID=A0ABS8PU40_9BACT|nr:hypothetical protein [Niabella pedocola]MCD2424597.1 hypothetical protein [Niabella pedocola]